MDATDLRLSGNGRLYVSPFGFFPDFEYAGAARLDSLAVARTLGPIVRHHTTRQAPVVTGGMTVRSWPGNGMRQALDDGVPIDLLVCYGPTCDLVDTSACELAITLEGAVATASQAGAATTIASGERNVIDETYTLSALRSCTIDFRRTAQRVGTLSGRVVAVDTDRHGGIWALSAATAASVDDLTLYCRPDPSADWLYMALGSYSARSGRFTLAVLHNYAVFTTGEGVMAVSIPATAADEADMSGPFALAPLGTTSVAPVAVLRAETRACAYAVHTDGRIWRIGDDLDCRQIATLPEAAVAVAGIALQGNAIAIGSATALYISDSYGRLRSGTRPASTTPLDLQFGATGNNVVAFTAAGIVYVSRNGGRVWNELYRFPGSVRAGLFSARSIGYAAVDTGSGDELWATVSGGHQWRRVTPSFGAAQLLCLAPLASGGILAGGRMGASGDDGAVFTFS